jgi:hypothetical protein
MARERMPNRTKIRRGIKDMLKAKPGAAIELVFSDPDDTELKHTRVFEYPIDVDEVANHVYRFNAVHRNVFFRMLGQGARQPPTAEVGSA